MNATTRKLLNFAFLFLTLGVVLYIGLKGNDIADLWNALQSFSLPYLTLCIAGWGGYVSMDALALHYFLRKQGHPITYRQSLYSSLIGIYYCNITPGASGGQPMQIYRMKQMGVPIGISGSALTVKFFCFQFMLLVAGAILWLFQGSFIATYISDGRWLIILGYVINFFSVGIVLFMAISKRGVRTIITLCIQIGARLRICKDPARSAAKWESHCSSFLSSVQLIRQRPKELFIQFGIALLQLFSLMSVTVFIYHAFGLLGTNNLQLITIGVLLYISASYTPLPGASGMQEGGFSLFFSGIFPSAYLFIALLIWRFSTYYISILIGIPISFADSFRTPPPKNNLATPKEPPSPHSSMGDNK